jgi:hypothetical protein
MTLAGPGPPEEVAPETARAAERLKDGQRPPPFEDVDATRVEQVRAGERSRDTRHRQEPDGPRHYLEVGRSIVRLAGGLPPISSSPRDASACDWTDGTDGRFSSVALGRSGWCGEMSPNRCRRTAPPGYVRSTHGRGVTEITARCALASTQGADAWEPRTLSSLEVIRWRRGRGSGRLASGAPRGAATPGTTVPASSQVARCSRRETRGRRARHPLDQNQHDPAWIHSLLSLSIAGQFLLMSDGGWSDTVNAVYPFGVAASCSESASSGGSCPASSLTSLKTACSRSSRLRRSTADLSSRRRTAA